MGAAPLGTRPSSSASPFSFSLVCLRAVSALELKEEGFPPKSVLLYVRIRGACQGLQHGRLGHDLSPAGPPCYALCFVSSHAGFFVVLFRRVFPVGVAAEALEEPGLQPPGQKSHHGLRQPDRQAVQRVTQGVRAVVGR